MQCLRSFFTVLLSLTLWWTLATPFPILVSSFCLSVLAAIVFVVVALFLLFTLVVRAHSGCQSFLVDVSIPFVFVKCVGVLAVRHPDGFVRSTSYLWRHVKLYRSCVYKPVNNTIIRHYNRKD